MSRLLVVDGLGLLKRVLCGPSGCNPQMPHTRRDDTNDDCTNHWYHINCVCQYYTAPPPHHVAPYAIVHANSQHCLTLISASLSYPEGGNLEVLRTELSDDGFDLEADWAALEANSRSTTTGRMPGIRAPNGEMLMAPPSNPKVRGMSGRERWSGVSAVTCCALPARSLCYGNDLGTLSLQLAASETIHTLAVVL